MVANRQDAAGRDDQAGSDQPGQAVANDFADIGKQQVQALRQSSLSAHALP